MKKINKNYLNLYKEIPLLFSVNLIKKNIPSKKTGKALIINPCVVGEFVASLPALVQFMKDSEFEFDLAVSPIVESLAKKIKGVRKVYTAKSVYSRKEENLIRENKKFKNYDFVFVMRISKNARNFLKKIKYQEVKTSLKPMVKYAFHLLNSNIRGEKPKQWREINFEMFNKKQINVGLEEIFDFSEEDYKKIKRLDGLKTRKKIILIHTGPVWIMKKWDNEKWAELIRKINSLGNYRFVFVGTGEAKKDFEEISDKLDFKIYSLINKVNLLELLLIMRKSNYFIGIDSGPRNMAHLADLRSVTLLGPSGRQFMPSNKKDKVIDKTTKWNLYETFFYKKNKFIDKITPEEVFEAFRKLPRNKKI